MYVETFQKLGLAQNEARIYETLLREGESPVGEIASHSKVHRRNVYDSLNRLIEKGLVFEILQRNENLYQAVDPHKLVEMLEEKQRELHKVLPELTTLYHSSPHEQDVYIYRGIEGWKNYLRDIIRIGKDVYTIGGKAQLNSPRLKGALEVFKADAEKNNITFHNLYDAEVKPAGHAGFLNREDGHGEESRFLPKEYSTQCTTAILADRIFIFSGISVGDFNEDISFTVIINQEIAAAYLKWWEFMWNMCAPRK